MLRSLDEFIPGLPGGSEFHNSYGHLLVLALPAGKHTIDAWQITHGTPCNASSWFMMLQDINHEGGERF